MTREEWEQQLDERMKWHSFLPLLGTKAFERLTARLSVTSVQQAWQTKKTPREATDEKGSEPLSQEREAYENSASDSGK